MSVPTVFQDLPEGKEDNALALHSLSSLLNVIPGVDRDSVVGVVGKTPENQPTQSSNLHATEQMFDRNVAKSLLTVLLDLEFRPAYKMDLGMGNCASHHARP